MSSLLAFASALPPPVCCSRASVPHVPMQRLKFFLRSLEMDLPAPPAVEAMASVSILTPVYKEAIVFSMRELEEVAAFHPPLLS